MNRVQFSAMALGLLLLGGCATPCCTKSATVAVGPCGEAVCPVVPVATVAPVVPVMPTAQKVQATGYGNIGNFSQYTQGQAKLMAIRAAKVDAYRNLAEQVHGVRVWGNTAVSAFVAQNDVIRTFVDSFIQGARVVNVTPVGDGNYEATVELELTGAFFDCLTPQGRCGAYRNVSSCSGAGCTSPSVTYTSY